MEVQQELKILISQLRDYLQAQRELGLDYLILNRSRGRQAEKARPLNLEEIRELLGDCKRCKLHSGRQNIVFGVGDGNSDLVFVGEAPGAEEDEQGEPFVGKAGQLLTRIIEAIGLKRNQVYICNIIKCRPPANRDPEPDEIAACEPFLIAQLQVIKPKLICALGTFAAKTLLRTKEPIGRLRGRFHSYQGIPLLPTFHPAYLLRNPSEKRKVWEDMQFLKREYERLHRREERESPSPRSFPQEERKQ